ncbi:iron complex outermembrane receptor protein [Parvibaculum sp. MBR-TMA-1.3b-4.2]
MKYRGMSLAGRLLAGTALCVSLSAAAIPARAADTADDTAIVVNDDIIQSIVVTAQKRSERTLDVPINITAYDGEFLKEMGITEFSTLSAFTPGLVVQEQSPNNPGFVIRGLTSDSGESNTEPRVSVYQDGVSISRSRGSVVELFDMERVEVLKGPQSTLFGRGALIGAVNLVQNKAEDDTYAQATLGIGTEGTREATAIANASLIEGKLYGRIAATYKHRDGYVDNELPSGVYGPSELNGKDTKAIRGSLHFDAAPETSFDLILNYQHDEPDPTGFKSGVIPAYNGDTSPYSHASLNADPRFEGGQLKIDRDVWGVTLLSDIGLTDTLSLSATSAFRRFDSLEVFDPDGSAFQLIESAEDAEGKQASQEIRLNYEQGKVKSFVGVDFFYEDGSQRVPLATDESQLALWLGASGNPAGAALWGLLSPVQQAAVSNAFANGNPQDPYFQAIASAVGGLAGLQSYHVEEYTNFSTTRSVDAFGDISVEVIDNLTLTGGLRWSYDNKTVGYQGGYINNPSTLSALAGGTGTLLAGDTSYQSASGSFTGLTWRLVAEYALSKDANVYASYARGRRPEVITPVVHALPGAFLGFATLKDETVDSYETGAKALLFGRRVEVDGSVFYYKYKNYQVVDTTALTPTVLNVGNATSYGGEAQLTYHATDWLDLMATYGYNHGRFDSDALAAYADNRFRLSPDHTLSFIAQAKWDVFGGQAFVMPSYTWQSKVYFEEQNQPAYTQGAYGLANLRAGWTTPNGAWTFTVFANNLFDKEYLIDAGNSGASIGSGTYIQGVPRILGVQTSVTF